MRRWLTVALACAFVIGAETALAGGSRGGQWRGSSVGPVAGSSGGGARHSGSGHHRPFFHHRRVIVGSTIFIGAVGYPYYYYAPPAYAAPPAYVEEPVTYIEQPPAEQFFYYCPDSRAYYPNVTTCPSPWLKVVP